MSLPAAHEAARNLHVWPGKGRADLCQVLLCSHLGNWHTVLTGSCAKVAQMMLMDVAEALAISPKNEGGPTGRSNNQSIGKSVCWFQLLQLGLCN